MLPTPTLFFPVYPLSKPETCSFSHPRFCPPSSQPSVNSDFKTSYQSVSNVSRPSLEPLPGQLPPLPAGLLASLPALCSASTQQPKVAYAATCPVGLNPSTGLIHRNKQEQNRKLLWPLKPAFGLQPPLCMSALKGHLSFSPLSHPLLSDLKVGPSLPLSFPSTLSSFLPPGHS